MTTAAIAPGGPPLPPHPPPPRTSTSGSSSSHLFLLSTDDPSIPPLANDPSSSSTKRFVLLPEQELRIEARVFRNKNAAVSLIIHKGSAEVWGYELATGKQYSWTGGGVHIPVYTFHGCIVDVTCDDEELENHHDHEDRKMLHMYVAEPDDTAHNIAYVNTHAQLEALRDEALLFASTSSSSSPESQQQLQRNGPRVLVVGGAESGTSSVVKLLVSYAVKLGRTPLWVDLDPNDNAVGLPGTLSMTVMNRDALSLSSLLQGGGGWTVGTTSPLSLWHGSTTPQSELMQAQISALGDKIYKRMSSMDNEWERSSGILVNAPTWMTSDEHVHLLFHTIQALDISVVLLTGHDKLYSILKKQYHDSAAAAETSSTANSIQQTKLVIVKLPRSGGVVSRDAAYMRHVRSRCIRRYFYGDQLVDTTSTTAAASASSSSTTAATPTDVSSTTTTTPKLRPSLTPFLLQVKFDSLRIYKCTSMSLASSLLPLGASQTTEVIQLQPVTVNEQLTHHVLAVCHPRSVKRYDDSGLAAELYNSGVAGFVVVERVLMDTEMVHLLTPCAGALPSTTLLTGDVTWMD